ncbi:MAG: prolyl oligopeptidase family serine peptidase [Polyangiaceae bacterium]|nr:prolyl oligopeptidase family serine peptidase [Polyangiaceae bacterium]
MSVLGKWLAPSLAALAVASLAGCDGSEESTIGGKGGSAGATSQGGCGSGGASTSSSTGGTGTGGQGGSAPLGGDRPAKLIVPESYDGSKPAPLVVLLHGYSASGSLQEIYFGFKSYAAERGYLYLIPDGTEDLNKEQFWNATDACCDFGKTGVDDSAYLSGLVDEVKAQYNVDAKRVYFVGHSNGGFMSYRMACDHADQIAAIVSLAGATFDDKTKCAPSQPLSVLQIHGTADATVLYDGGQFGATAYPSATETVEMWAQYNGCDLTSAAGDPIDLESGIVGSESQVSKYNTGCSMGTTAELWSIEGGSHIPALTPTFRSAIFDFLDAHPKP